MLHGNLDVGRCGDAGSKRQSAILRGPDGARIAARSHPERGSGSDRLLEFLLCNLAPDQFKRNADVKVDVGVNVAERLQAGRKRTGGG